MVAIRVTKALDAPPSVVWSDIERIGTHVEWMHDAVAIEFVTDIRSGPGTVFDCRTKVGPFRLVDRMEITDWDESRRIGVRHVGLVAGTGQFTLDPLENDRTRFMWEETLRFPWWLGGPVGARLGAPVLRHIWRKNLDNLAERFEGRAGL